MKRICILLAVATCFAACGSNAEGDATGTDTTNSVTLPENRSSDSLVVPDSTTIPSRMGADSTGVRKDSMK